MNALNPSLLTQIIGKSLARFFFLSLGKITGCVEFKPIELYLRSHLVLHPAHCIEALAIYILNLKFNWI